MTESNVKEPSQVWETLSDPEREACVYFAVSDWKTGVGKEYLTSMDISDETLAELVKRGVVEMKSTWKMFQDLADGLEGRANEIRKDILSPSFKLEDDEREILQSYDRYKSIAERKDEAPRYHLASEKLQDYIKQVAD